MPSPGDPLHLLFLLINSRSNWLFSYLGCIYYRHASLQDTWVPLSRSCANYCCFLEAPLHGNHGQCNEHCPVSKYRHTHTHKLLLSLDKTDAGTNILRCFIHLYPFAIPRTPNLMNHSVLSCQVQFFLVMQRKNINRRKRMMLLLECFVCFTCHPIPSHFISVYLHLLSSVPIFPSVSCIPHRKVVYDNNHV